MSDRVTVQRLQDAALAVLLAGVGLAEIWVPFSSVQGEGSRGLTTALTILICLALTLRRVYPLAAAVGVLAVLPALTLLVGPVLVLFWGQFVPMVVAVYSVARHAPGRQGYAGGLVAAGTLLYMDLTIEVLQTPGEFVFHWGVFIVTWSAGRTLRVMESRTRESMRRAIDAEVASAERTMAALVEERTRIARELHDVVAHSVSMMVVQAGAAEQVVDDDPEHVRRALATIRTTGTGALAEMRRVVTMLRDGDEAGDLAPQPGLDGVPGLVEEARSAGIDATLVVEGEERPLPVGLGLAAYRIVQEALTNVRRHAAATRVRVLLRYTADDLEVEVSDDGTGAHEAVNGDPGHGLIGMRERAALYGGRVETASGAGSGFTVRAVLPVAAS